MTTAGTKSGDRVGVKVGTKAAGELSGSSSFEEAVRPRSARRRLIDEATGSAPTPRSLTLELMAPNPRNPRASLGDLEQLRSLTQTQLQPCLVVSRAAYLRLWPQDEEKLAEGTRYVVVNGCRRYAAAQHFGLAELEVTVKDQVAETRESLLAAAIQENIDRQDFDLLEEARAVEAMVLACEGSSTAAATRLNRTKGWVSQRRALLELSEQMQAALRQGELPVREARRLARVPQADQYTVWRREVEAARQRRAQDRAERLAADSSAHGAALPAPRDPAAVAEQLLAQFSREQVAELVRLLTAER